MSLGWTEDRIIRLKQLWADGHSASETARRLGGTTRNAVIGKIHRLGLGGRRAPYDPRGRPIRRPSRPVGAPARAAQRPAQPQRVAAPPNPTPRSLRSTTPETLEAPGTATVRTLGAHMCRWPIGDPGAPDFTFCGRPADDRRPYCAEHRKVAHQPRQPPPLTDDPVVRRALAGLVA